MKEISIDQSQAASPKLADVSVNDGTSKMNGELQPVSKIEQSIAYMLKHLDKPMQVSTLASQVNISLSHFFVLFKRQTGSAPIDYFIRLRMTRARELFSATSLNVKEVATTLGYDDPFYFSRVFKSVNKVAPSQYRTMARGWRNALKNTVSSRTYAFLAPGREIQQLESRENFSSRHPKKIHQNRSIFHSTPTNLCHNATIP